MKLKWNWNEIEMEASEDWTAPMDVDRQISPYSKNIHTPKPSDQIDKRDW